MIQVKKEMELSTKQQVFEALKKSKKVLLTTKEHPTEDAVSALIALGLFLEKNGKEVDMVTSGPVPKAIAFLPKVDEVGSELKKNKNFMISLDASDNEISQFHYDYDKDNKKLNIFITPKEGAYTDAHVSTKMLGFGYDMIVVINSEDFERLGEIYVRNTDLFYETPIINVDNSSSNEQYGEINLVNPTASSISEVVFEIIEAFGDQSMDKNISTCLLSGLISATKSFQNSKSTPQSLTLAAKLVAGGANQQDVVNKLFKSKSLSTLKLWGRALARVKHCPEHKAAWSLISQKDFLNSGASVDDLDSITDEIMSSVAGTDITFVVYEVSKKNKIKSAGDVSAGSAADIEKGEIGIIIKAANAKQNDQLARLFDITSKNGFLKVKVPEGNLMEVEKDVIGKIKGMSV